MLTIEINKTFSTQKECDAWEKENLNTFIPEGMVMLMSCHESVCGLSAVKLTQVICV